MSAVRRFAQALRRACVVFTLLSLAAPCALGAAMGPVLRQLGAPDEHVCKCGMKPGTCGCPECARLARQRRAENAPSPVPILKRHCEDDGPAMLLGAALPAGVLAASENGALPLPGGERLPVIACTDGLLSADDEPPTPPPRIATV